MKKNIALLNDTRNHMHHGCELVIRQIRKHLESRSINIHSYCSYDSEWDKNKHFLSSLNMCDGILVNGEGTIHHGRSAGEKLLQVSLIAQKLNVPCYLINATYQENPNHFQEYLRLFTGVYVRESASKAALEEAGIMSTVVPDLTLSSTYDATQVRKGIAVTDSAMTPISVKLFEQSHRKGFSFLPIVRSYKNEEEKSLLELLRRTKFELSNRKVRLLGSNDYLVKRNLYIKSTVADYLNAIASKELIISGRFHADCFCILTNTPFLALEGNSHKVSSMISDIGLSSDRVIDATWISMTDSFSELSFSDREKSALKHYCEKAKDGANDLFDSIARDLGCR